MAPHMNSVYETESSITISSHTVILFHLPLVFIYSQPPLQSYCWFTALCGVVLRVLVNSNTGTFLNL